MQLKLQRTPELPLGRFANTPPGLPHFAQCCGTPSRQVGAILGIRLQWPVQYVLEKMPAANTPAGVLRSCCLQAAKMASGFQGVLLQARLCSYRLRTATCVNLAYNAANQDAKSRWLVEPELHFTFLTATCIILSKHAPTASRSTRWDCKQAVRFFASGCRSWLCSFPARGAATVQALPAKKPSSACTCDQRWVGSWPICWCGAKRLRYCPCMYGWGPNN